MTLKLYEEVNDERERQNKIHPELPEHLLQPGKDPTKEQIKKALEYIQAENNLAEAQKEHSWYGILYEELKEIFASDTKEELHNEIVQTISVLVRLDEAINEGKV